MSDKDTVEYDVKGLERLIKALKNVPSAKIGVLGKKTNRVDGDENNNATIGAKHEFGSDGMPQRSFLRVPLIENLQSYLEKSGAFNEDSVKKILKAGSVRDWMQKIGLVAETVIADAFDTGGFGKWKPSNMKLKKNHQTLVETQQLRNSITSEVEEE